MKTLLLLSTLATPVIEKGLYICVNGNEESICDQTVIPKVVGGEVISLKVTYDGWCGGQGPYTYPCGNGECGDSAIRFKFTSPTSYSWQNVPYGFHCEFSLNASQN